MKIKVSLLVFLSAVIMLTGCSKGHVKSKSGTITKVILTRHADRDPDEVMINARGKQRALALVKAVDFEASRKKAHFADLLIEETLRDPGVVECGHKDGHRWSIGLEGAAVPEEGRGIDLNRETVFVVTGAAGSIVSAIVADLAAASGGTFHLLDLAPEPDPEDNDLQAAASRTSGLAQKASRARVRYRNSARKRHMTNHFLKLVDSSRKESSFGGLLTVHGTLWVAYFAMAQSIQLYLLLRRE